MPAFPTLTELYSYFRQKAQEFNCNPCFDLKQAEIEEMNEKGANGVPGCLCAIKFVGCPCTAAEKQIEKDGMCHCEIFRRK